MSGEIRSDWKRRYNGGRGNFLMSCSFHLLSFFAGWKGTTQKTAERQTDGRPGRNGRSRCCPLISSLVDIGLTRDLLTSRLGPIPIGIPSCLHQISCSFISACVGTEAGTWFSSGFYGRGCHLTGSLSATAVLWQSEFFGFSGCDEFPTGGACIRLHCKCVAQREAKKRVNSRYSAGPRSSRAAERGFN